MTAERTGVPDVSIVVPIYNEVDNLPELVRRIGAHSTPGGQAWLLNVNIPNLPLDELKGFRLCRLGRRHSAESVIVQQNPRGETMYWIGAAGAAKDDADGTDFHATTQGHIAITPLKVDLTDHGALGYWGQAFAVGGPKLHGQEEA